jgi:hypothetical protein
MAFSDFSLTGGILFTMWFFIAAIALTVILLAFYSFRQRTGKTVPDKDRLKTEISGDIGIPLEVIDPEKAGQIDRRTGVALPRARPGTIHSESDGSLASRDLRKVDLSKEVELVWEAGDVIEFQLGAWAVAKDPSEFGSAVKSEGRLEDRATEIEPTRRPQIQYALPQRYGKDRLVLMTRDPYWVYAYWEVTHERYKEMYEKHVHHWGLSRPVLRLHDITPGISETRQIDVFLNDEADNWYLNVGRPRHTIVAELGRLFPENVFHSLVKSNQVTLPADDLSEEICLEWAPLDWHLSYGRFKGKIGISSPQTWGNANK